MKTKMMLMCLLISLAGCNGNSNVSVLGNPESEGSLGIRVGTDVITNVEVGALTYFRPYDDSDFQAYGAYSLIHIPVGPVTPYLGAEARIGEGTWDIDNTIEPFVGMIAGPVFCEFQPEAIDGEDDKILFGVRFGF
jgi:hypothetical protein